jgi:hypothetical protein
MKVKRKIHSQLLEFINKKKIKDHPLTNSLISLHEHFNNCLHFLHQNQIQQCLPNSCQPNLLPALSKAMTKDSLLTHPTLMENQPNTTLGQIWTPP